MQELRKHTKHPAKHQVRLVLILVGLMIIATPVLEPTVFAQSPVTTPSWTFTGSLNANRAGHTATLLPDGRVLVVGGFVLGEGSFSSAELYDPATGMWRSTGNFNEARGNHTATLLPNGKVLIAGGQSATSALSINSAELYDAATGTWSSTGSLKETRAEHTATVLPNGNVLVAGGNFDYGNSSGTNSAELYHPTTGTWSSTGNLNEARGNHTATLLPNGKVLVAGGGPSADAPLNSTELYDPVAGIWTSTGNLNTARLVHTATLLPNGKVLVAAGRNYEVDPGSGSLNSAELYDSVTGSWSITANLNTAHLHHTATLLPNGEVLVAGGRNFGVDPITLNSAELYDSVTGSWSITASLNTGRISTANLLLNGRVLVAGGLDDSNYLNTAELYDPGTNPIDDAQSFVRQHYRDFLNREPDAGGLAYWTDNITKCTDPSLRPAAQTEAECIDKQKVTTSAAFFLSPEFQYTGYFVYRLYKGSLLKNGAGRFPTYQEFLRDVRQVASGIIQNNQVSAAAIEANKKSLTEEFTRRAEFRSLYDPLSNFDYVERLFQTTGINVSATEKQALVEGLNNQTETRASVLQKVVDGAVVIAEGNQQFTTPYGRAFYEKEVNPAFVLMEYFGYLRRDPDSAGYQHWLDKLNFYGNYIDAEMVKSFIVSPEYRARFGLP